MSVVLRVRDALVPDLEFLTQSNAAMAWETERKTLDRAVLGSGIAAVLQSPTRGFYLIAERGDQPVGCLLITLEWSDWRDGYWWWLQSVYIVPACRRNGVFRALHAEVEWRARQAREVIGLRLYVERGNRTAQAAYHSLGMIETDYRLFERLLPPAAAT